MKHFKSQKIKFKICFTGGGSLGHVIPCLNLSMQLDSSKWEKFYLCSKNPIEIETIKNRDKNINLQSITCEKLRRFATFAHLFIPLKITLGIIQSLVFLLKNNVDVVFSTGGYVSFPAVIAAWILRKKIISYELDISQSLSSKLTTKFSSIILTNFMPLKEGLLKNKNNIKVEHIGYICHPSIKAALNKSIINMLKTKKNFDINRKVVLIFGGSAGSKIINEYAYNFLDEILIEYSVIHFCGKNKARYSEKQNYITFEYAGEEFLDFIKFSSIVIARAGANSISEILSLNKPSILIPLSKKISRGEQIENAMYMKSIGASEVIMEEDLGKINLAEVVKSVLSKEKDLIQNMNSLTKDASVNFVESTILNLIN